MYISNIRTLSCCLRFEGHNIRKTRPIRISPAEPVGLPETLNHRPDTIQQAK